MRHIGHYKNGCLGMVSSYHIEILKGKIVWGVLEYKSYRCYKLAHCLP
jgi:hypothetical protein